MDSEKIIKELHDAKRYLEDKEWSDRGASPYIDAIINAITLLKQQSNDIHHMKLIIDEYEKTLKKAGLI